MTTDIAAALRRLRAALQLVASQPDAYGFPVQIGDLHAVLAELDHLRVDLDEAIALLGAAIVGQLTIQQRQRHGVLLARHPEMP